jgi:hypothetical protein
MSTERRLRIALGMLRVGIIACVLAIIPRTFTGICLCNAPKELVFEAVGLMAAALCLLCLSRIRVTCVDLLFVFFLVFSLSSCLLTAIDRWEAFRAVGISLTGVAVFWSSRVFANRGQRRELLEIASLAVALVAVTVVLDAVGMNQS